MRGTKSQLDRRTLRASRRAILIMELEKRLKELPNEIQHLRRLLAEDYAKIASMKRLIPESTTETT